MPGQHSWHEIRHVVVTCSQRRHSFERRAPSRAASRAERNVWTPHQQIACPACSECEDEEGSQQETPPHPVGEERPTKSSPGHEFGSSAYPELPDEEEAAGEAPELVPCEICGRSFDARRMSMHERVCSRINQQPDKSIVVNERRADEVRRAALAVLQNISIPTGVGAYDDEVDYMEEDPLINGADLPWPPLCQPAVEEMYEEEYDEILEEDDDAEEEPPPQVTLTLTRHPRRLLAPT